MIRLRTKDTKETVLLASPATFVEFSDGKRILVPTEKLEEYVEPINWEQRRYEIAKDTLQTEIKTSSAARTYGEYAVSSVNYADALIAALKEDSKNRR